MKAAEMINEVKNNNKRILIMSYTKPQVIDRKCILRFEKAGYEVLTDDGNGYRIQNGNNKLFVFSGSIKLID